MCRLIDLLVSVIRHIGSFQPFNSGKKCFENKCLLNILLVVNGSEKVTDLKPFVIICKFEIKKHIT